MTPRLSPRVTTSLLSSPSLAAALSRFLPSCPAFPLSRRVSLLSLSPSSPFAFFFALDIGTKRDAIQSFEPICGSAYDRVAHLAAIFIRSELRELLSSRGRNARLSLPRAGISRVRNVPRESPVFRPPVPSLVAASFVTSRYGFRELSAVSHHHSPCHLSETHARARAVSLSALLFLFSLSLSLSFRSFSPRRVRSPHALPCLSSWLSDVKPHDFTS